MTNMTRARTRLRVRRLGQDPVLRKLVATQRLGIIGGHYDVSSGVVTTL